MATNRVPLIIDVHAHSGRCFLAGLADADPLVALLGGADVAGALTAARTSGLAAVTLSTVADLRVLAPDPDRGLRATRQFRPGEARADHARQLAGLAAAIAAAGLDVGRQAADIERAHSEERLAVLVSCEGGDFLDGQLDGLAAARRAGASSLTLVHYRVNEIGDAQTEEPVHHGLSPFGLDVVAECNRLGVIIDCAHATFETTVGVLEASSDPVMISHSHLDHESRHHPRLLSSEHAQAVASAGGLIGAWPSGVTSTSLGDFADEIVRLVDLIGADHVAIGTDMDANYRPVLTGYADFAALRELMSARGLDAAEIGKILGANALRLFATVVG
jgi:membrane dipeptidase